MIHAVSIDGEVWCCDMRRSKTFQEEYDMRIYNRDKSKWIAHVDHVHNVPINTDELNEYVKKIVKERE